MENLKLILTEFSKTLLFVLLFLFGSSNLQGQKNAVKITPVKPFFHKLNVGYERFIKNNWSVTADHQFWFMDKYKIDDNFFDFGSDETHNFVNQGFRSSIELRKYFNVGDKNGKRQDAFNIGISLFLGKHHVETNSSGYDEYKTSLVTLFGSDPTYRSYKSSYHGEADIISKGIGVHIGFRVLYKNGFFINYDISGNRSWNNYGADKYSLISKDPTYPTKEVSFDAQVNGFNLEPNLSVGYMF